MSTAYPLPRQTREAILTASAGQTVFGPFDFILFAALDVEVSVKPVGASDYTPLDADDFTVTVAPPATAFPALFTVTLDTARVAGDLVWVRGARLGSRTTNVTQGGRLQSQPLELEFDRVVATEQELRRDVDASLAGQVDLQLQILTEKARAMTAEAELHGEVLAEKVRAIADVDAEGLMRLAGDQQERIQRTAADLALRDMIATRIPVYTDLLFVNRAAVEFATVVEDQLWLRTSGYYAPGDGGGALYKRVDAEPAHAGKIQSSDGAWWAIAETSLTPLQFGGRNTGDVADNEINSSAFANGYAAVPDYGEFCIPAGVYRVAETVVFDRSTVAVVGAGSAAVTISGTFADGDVVRFGQDAQSTSRMRASGFRVSSSLQKTSGAGIKLRRVARSSFADVIADGQDGTGYLTDGIHFDAVDHVIWMNFQSFASQRAVVVNGTAGDGLKADLLLLAGKISGEVQGETTGDGIVCAGGFGGLYIDDVNTIKVRDGLTINQSEVAEANREIMVSSTSTLDSCSRDGLVLDDPADGATLLYHGWIASCGANCVNVKQWLRSHLQLGDAVIFKGTTNGILVSDATAYITLPGAMFRDCGTAFNNAAGAVNVMGLDECIFRNNATNIAGVQALFTTRVGAGNFTPTRQQKGLGVEEAAYLVARFGTGPTNAPRYMLARTRSATVNGYDAVLVSDSLGEISVGGADGAKIVEAAKIAFVVNGAPGADNMPGAILLLTTPAGSNTPVERLRIEQDGKLVHRANNTVVVDANSHIGLRSYTVATLPSATPAARLIYVSDGASNKRLAVSDGANWRWLDGAIVS